MMTSTPTRERTRRSARPFLLVSYVALATCFAGAGAPAPAQAAQEPAPQAPTPGQAPAQPQPSPAQPQQPATQQPATTTPAAPADPAAAQPQVPTAPLLRPTAETGVESFYRLQASDVIIVKYRYTPEYDTTVTVRPDGFITLPIVGEVRVGELTVAETHRAIIDQAMLRLREPELTVELKDFQKPRFVVGGEVAKPGQFELRGRVTLLEAVAMAGGLKTSAKHSQVVLVRRYGKEEPVARVVNAKELAHVRSVQEDPVLLPGDFLFVPQNNISKVERFIPVSSIGWLLNIVIP